MLTRRVWDKHVENLSKTISPKIGLLRKLKLLLPQHCVELVYKSTIQTHIDYCITTWGFAAMKYLPQIQLQNRAARIITGNWDWDIRGIDIVSDRLLCNVDTILPLYWFLKLCTE